jgi:hypothetical protein
MDVSNYNRENLLFDANELNAEIKDDIKDGDRDTLETRLEEVNDYIIAITEYTFAPRTDGLTKDNILRSLRDTKTTIEGLLSATGGRRRKGRKSRTGRKTRKTRKTRRTRKSRKH